jgi:hypothetical protein
MPRKQGCTGDSAAHGRKSVTKDRLLLEEACELFESGDRSRSIRLFQRAARMGNLEAQTNLGNIYDDGDGVRASFDKARYWYPVHKGDKPLKPTPGADLPESCEDPALGE